MNPVDLQPTTGGDSLKANDFRYAYGPHQQDFEPRFRRISVAHHDFEPRECPITHGILYPVSQTPPNRSLQVSIPDILQNDAQFAVLREERGLRRCDQRCSIWAKYRLYDQCSLVLANSGLDGRSALDNRCFRKYGGCVA